MDDVSLLSHRQQDAQEKLGRVTAEAEKTGLRINTRKTEILRINNKRQGPVRLQQEQIKEVKKFTYLGSVVSKDGGADEDIKSRIIKARHVFRTLTPISRSSALSLHNKIRIFNTNVKPLMLYGSETWRTTKTNRNKLQKFVNRCLCNILNIRWSEIISNKELWQGQNKPQLKKTSRRGNGGGLATRYANLHQTLPDRYWTGIPRENEKVVGRGRLGKEALTLK